MIELRVRKRVDRLVNPIGRGLARIGVTPTWLTMIGLGVTVIGAVLVARESFVAGALVALTGAALDGLDGSVARARGSASLSGALLDSVADRMGETAMWAGLAFALSDSARLSLLCVWELRCWFLMCVAKRRVLVPMVAAASWVVPSGSF